MSKFSRSLAEYFSPLAFLCCYYINPYITCLIVNFNIVSVRPFKLISIILNSKYFGRI